MQRQLEQHVASMFAAPAWRASPRQCELADRLKVGWARLRGLCRCWCRCHVRCCLAEEATQAA